MKLRLFKDIKGGVLLSSMLWAKNSGSFISNVSDTWEVKY